MADDYISLAQQLITLQTTPVQPAALRAALDLVEQHCAHLTIEHFVLNNSPSVLIYNRPTRPQCFRLILNGHVDVIPGKGHQYMPTIKNQRLYGTGALDMKANLAVLVMLFAQYADSLDAPVALQVVTDEELGGFDGTYHQITQGVRSDFVLSAETTNFDIVHQAKGILWLKIHVTGKTAHGAYPWRGQNAIITAQQLASRILTRFPQPKRQAWCTTVNVANISSTNTAFNKVPDRVELWLDVRFVPDDRQLIYATITHLCEPFEIEVIVHEPPLNTPPTHPDIQRLVVSTTQVRTKSPRIRSAQGSSDARHYMHVGCAGVEFGAYGGGIASDNEWISIPSLHEYYRIMHNFLVAIR
jgi:succinyl-diaminopimelate desuccinylase